MSSRHNVKSHSKLENVQWLYWKQAGMISQQIFFAGVRLQPRIAEARDGSRRPDHFRIIQQPEVSHTQVSVQQVCVFIPKTSKHSFHINIRHSHVSRNNEHIQNCCNLFFSQNKVTFTSRSCIDPNEAEKYISTPNRENESNTANGIYKQWKVWDWYKKWAALMAKRCDS